MGTSLICTPLMVIHTFVCLNNRLQINFTSVKLIKLKIGQTFYCTLQQFIFFSSEVTEYSRKSWHQESSGLIIDYNTLLLSKRVQSLNKRHWNDHVGSSFMIIVN